MRIAVVGAGPAGIYSAEALAGTYGVEVDIYESLPVPCGLVRYGVAPDHFSIRSVRDKLVETLDNPLVRFRGNVRIGSDITIEELSNWYDAVIYTYGASSDRKLGIPGEDHSSSIAATEIVKWYTGHPDAHDFGEQIKKAKKIAVIGLGNVAVDVTRILMRPVEELRETDMPEHVLEALAASEIEELHVVGRRGPQHATFTTKELKELGELEGIGVSVDFHDLPADDAVASEGNRVTERNLAVIRQWAVNPDANLSRWIRFHFYRTPVEFDPDSKILETEEMSLHEDGSIAATGIRKSIPADIVIRSVGYRGIEIEGLPFDSIRNVIPSVDGKVESLNNSYVAGWIKRGPSGIIGTNKKDAVATVSTIMKNLENVNSKALSAGEIDEQLHQRGISFVDVEGWKRIDAAERALGSQRGRDRTTIHDHLELLRLASESERLST
jgi:ferredoxin/flavodoxin---NADP+ reductase